MTDIKIEHPNQLEEFFEQANKYADPEQWSEFIHIVNAIGCIEGWEKNKKGLYLHNDRDVCYIYNNEGLVLCDIVFKRQLSWEQSEAERARIAKEHHRAVVMYYKGWDKDINKKWIEKYFGDDKDMTITSMPCLNYTYDSSMLDYERYYGTASHLDRDVRKAIRLVFDNELHKEQITDTKWELILGDYTISMCHISELSNKQIYEQVELARVWKSHKVSNGYLGIIGSSAFIIERLTGNKWKFNYKSISKSIPLYILELRYKGILLTTHHFTKINDRVYTLPGYKPVVFEKGILNNEVPTKIVRAVSNLKYYTIIRAIKETLQSHTDIPFILNDMCASYSLSKESIYNNTYLDNMNWRKGLDDYKTKHKPARILKQWKAHPKKEFNLLKDSNSKTSVLRKNTIF